MTKFLFFFYRTDGANVTVLNAFTFKGINLKIELSVEHSELEKELNVMKAFLLFQEDHVCSEVIYSCDKLASVVAAC
jgi:uncharacterized metal-binding protein